MTKLLSILKAQQGPPNKEKLLYVFYPNELLCFANRSLPYPLLDAPPPLPPSLMWCWMWKEDRQEVEGSFVGKVKGKAEKIGGYHIPVRKRTESLSLGHPFFEKCLKVCIFKDPCDLVSYPPSQSGYSVL